MKVLLVDDDDTFRELIARELRLSGHELTTAATGSEGQALALADEPDVVLLDLNLPDRSGMDVLEQLRAARCPSQVIVLTAHGTVDRAIAALKLGAYDFLQKPAPLEVVESAITRACERRRLGDENARLKDGLQPTGLDAEMVGQGPQFEALGRFIGKVARSDAAVLIRGETGTGKEMVAAAIHRASLRSDQPFVVVDCASLNENLLQSELFGHERGAFTGAVKQRHGLFEAADGGTVFLDEIGDVSATVQAGLLRVLESSAFRRLGGTREVRVNVRLLAATNRDLERLMKAGQFRQDLFFRLNTIHLEISPLRERRTEIPHLVEHFVARHNALRGTHKRITPGAMAELIGYAWPGNVRELRHAVERALIMADDDGIVAADLPDEVRCRAPGGRDPDAAETLLAVERRYIAEVLQRTGGHRARAAAILGVSERNLYRKIREYQLEPGAEGPSFPPDSD
ncbi:MAG TPA: sigma-54 dependent transcriptional regulator [Anaeromyxobacteraceae bacterium]|jgi:DNA-binding NtrC family response regulator|nr:sigma-54 dependent transcriptional regulator [Anaeromyxobacteraceae bacterium]